MTKRYDVAAARDEAGMALVTVIAMTSVLAILMVAAVSMAVSGLQKSRNDQDWSAALAAAYAGIEEYQSRLADDPDYWTFGNPASAFSNPGAIADPGVALPPAVQANPAFELGTGGTWAIVGNSDEDDDGATAYYRYEVNNTDYNSNGLIQLRSTGRVGEETRTLVAHLRQSGFLDFVYFTDYEYRDPDMTGSSCDGEKHEWESGYNCGSHVIQFGDSDILDGPVHSNDTILTCSAEFLDRVTTAAPGGKYEKPAGYCDPDFALGPPSTVPFISMPETNEIMQRYTRADLLTEDVPTPGCMYTGPTEITLNSDGTMKVISPWTRFTNVKGDDLAEGVTNNACGTIPDLTHGGATVPVPDNNVIYVQSIPDLSSNDNYSSYSATTNGSRCKSRDGVTIPRKNDETVNAINYPQHASEQVPEDGTGQDASYGCRNGDLFIKGTLSGTSATFAAQNYIYVTGNIRYASGEPDTKLGLIGTNAVWVWNPMTSGGTPLIFPSGNTDRRIDGAVMSVQHSFGVQNYQRGGYALGDLTIYGALVQKYRGTVGTSGGSGGTGFDKDYRYDPDFKYNPPPRFLSPTNSTFGVKTWIEVSAVFHADGSYR